MHRRDFLGSAILGTAWLSLPGCGGEGIGGASPDIENFKMGPDGKRLLAWRNWSGRLHDYPQLRATPDGEDELVSLLRDAQAPIRPIGAGHSFSPLGPTDGTLVSLRNFTGVTGFDRTARTAKIGAGTRLNAIGKLLTEGGMALPNMPDVDEQTLAGALSTGTHGTGPTLKALHGYVQSLRLVTAAGEVIECSREHEAAMFYSALVSIGSLGVITQYTLNNMPRYRLKRRVWVEPFEQLVDRAPELALKHRNFEFYYVPYSDYAIGITLDKTEEPVTPRTEDTDNSGLMELKQLRDYLGWWSSGRRFLINKVMADLPEEVNIDEWWKIFPSDREVRFNEMEYHLPRAAMGEALRSVRDTIENNEIPIFFPVEVRFVKSDDAWLSPFYDRDSCSIAVHRFHEDDPLPYFRQIEPLYSKFDGRPHWGKMHTKTAAQFSTLYPRWNEFLSVRKRADPQGRMLNAHLREVFGVG